MLVIPFYYTMITGTSSLCSGQTFESGTHPFLQVTLIKVKHEITVSLCILPLLLNVNIKRSYY